MYFQPLGFSVITVFFIKFKHPMKGIANTGYAYPHGLPISQKNIDLTHQNQ